MEMVELLEKVRDWLPKKEQIRVRVGLFSSQGHIGIALIEADGSAVRAYRWLESSDPAERHRFVERFVADHECEGAPAYAVLGGNRYQTQQLEINDIPDADLAGVARFKVRDVADVAVDNAAVSARRLVRERESSSGGMVFVAVVEQPVVDEVVALLEEAGLAPQAVHTRETAMTHLAAVQPDADQGLAMLKVEQQGGVVTLGRGDSLYLPRAHNYGVDQIQSQGALGSEGLALELQRSLDFYESQIANDAAARVYLLPTTMDTVELGERLRQSIVAPLQVYDLNDVVPYTGEGELTLAEQSMVALAVGAALPVSDPPGASFYQPPVYRFEWLSADGFGVVVGATALVVALASGGHYWLASDREQQVAEREQERAALEAEVDELAEELAAEEVDPELVAQHDQLEATLKGQQRLEEELVGLSPEQLEGFSPFMVALSRHGVDGMWLTRLRYEPGARLLFEGRAWEPRLVPRFIGALSEEPVFEGTRFEGFEIMRDEGHQQVRFRLSTTPLEAEQ